MYPSNKGNKVALIKGLVKMVEDLFDVPDEKVDMNDGSSCAFVHCNVDVLYDYDIESSRMNRERYRLLALSDEDKYPKPKGMAGKLEFARRVTKIIKKIPTWE